MAAPPRRRVLPPPLPDLATTSPPALPNELIKEILLRLPPDDPACLLRASLVCKAWSGIVSHPAFRRRLHELHRAPPVLGFLHDWDDDRIPHFVSTTASSFSLAAPDRRFWRALDCRHGRAVFLSGREDTNELLVWEPITGTQQRIPVPAAFEMTASTASSTTGLMYRTAAVVCAADGCDHQGCHGGPFCVLLVSTASILSEYGPFDDFVTSACLYSSETGAWGELTSMQDEFMMDFTYFSSVLVGRSLLYFLSYRGRILEYDLATHGLAVLSTPPQSICCSEGFNVMLTEDGGLALIEALSPDLKLWEREASEGTDAQWVLSQVISLDFLLPAIVGPRDSVLVLGFAEGANTIFVNTLHNLFMIDLQSEQVKKVCDGRGFCNLIPVVSFYTPHSRLQVPGDENHNPALQLNLLSGGQQGGWEEKSLELAQELFDKGCKAIKEKNFANAVDCFSHALEIRVRHYGGLALECASTFSRYGCALVCKAWEATNPPGANLNGKDLKDENMTGNGDDSDLNLAWKMLDTARVIVAKGPENTMEKCTIFYALAEVAMKREDWDNSIGYYFKALAILEHLVRPDHIRIAELYPLHGDSVVNHL
ncbi:uncharacterized protein [Triticum aestivum]|nr:uncharacterized protein LOC123117566 [Triticum aestivum]